MRTFLSIFQILLSIVLMAAVMLQPRKQGRGGIFGGAKDGQIVFRLRDNAAPIVWYDVMSGGDDDTWGRRLTGFKLESSVDGETWQTVSEVNVTDRTRTSKTWYSGTSCGYLVYHFTGTTADATIPAASTVEVRPGATLTVETSMTISSLRLDLDVDANAASPVIEGLHPTANGKLYIVTADAGTLNSIAARRDIPVRLDLRSLSPDAKSPLRHWNCYINGKRTAYHLSPQEGTDQSKLVWGSGLFIIVR